MTDKHFIPGFEGLYEMDDNGDVHTIPRCYYDKLGRKCYVKARKLKPSKHCTGYLTVGLSGVTHRLHRLVAMVFHENPDNKEYVNHIDADKHNYHPSNLEWATHRENTDHAMALGLMATGERNGSAKITDKQVVEAFQRVMSGYKIATVCGELNINRNTLTKALSRLTVGDREAWEAEMFRRKSPKVQKELL